MKTPACEYSSLFDVLLKRAALSAAVTSRVALFAGVVCLVGLLSLYLKERIYKKAV